MDKKRIVITGIGVVSSIGIGKEAFWDSLFAGKSGIKPVTLFDTSKTRSKLAGEISDFDPVSILGPKGLRNLDRTTLLALSAAKLCLTDAKVQVTRENTDQIGVILGCTMGSIKSISDFDKEAISEGPYYVNPALFPNTVMNSPASQISIKFGLRALNTTISTGFTASLDSMIYAISCLRLGRAKMILAGGVEELCEPTFLGFYKMGALAGTREDKLEICAPFDKKRNGLVLGEGASILLLETMESAIERGAVIYAELKGVGSAFDPYRWNRYNLKAEGAAKSVEITLEDAGFSQKEIDYILTGANSTVDGDVMEARAIRKIFDGESQNIPVCPIKALIGECFSATSALEVASACGIFNSGKLPLVRIDEPDRRCLLRFDSDCNKEIERILLTSFSPMGTNSSMVLKKVL